MAAALRRFSKQLNKNLPASDLWFLSLYKAHGLLREDDLFNEPFENTCIPDVVNHILRYIIEVQDPTHKLKERIIRDAKKNALFAKSGYRTFYVWAWDHYSFDAFLEQFKEFRRRGWDLSRDREDAESALKGKLKSLEALKTF